MKINLEFRTKSECYVSTSTVGNCDITISGSTTFCVPSLETASLYVDYVYLDTDERRRFAQVSHEYLIEQVQFTGDESITVQNVKIKMNFNHPVKELIWVVQRDSVVQPGINQWSNYTDDYDNDTLTNLVNGNLTALAALRTNVESGWSATSFPDFVTFSQAVSAYPSGTGTPSFTGATTYNTTAAQAPYQFPQGPGAIANAFAPVNFGVENSAGAGSDHAGLAPINAGRNPVVRAKIQLNGHDRFSERLGSYFNLVQPWEHHTNVPAVGINVYSFALKPEEHQPSGTCNFSRIDSAVLQLQLTAKAAISSKVRVYATNYNVLRIMSGINYTTCAKQSASIRGFAPFVWVKCVSAKRQYGKQASYCAAYNRLVLCIIIVQRYQIAGNSAKKMLPRLNGDDQPARVMTSGMEITYFLGQSAANVLLHRIQVQRLDGIGDSKSSRYSPIFTNINQCYHDYVRIGVVLLTQINGWACLRKYLLFTLLYSKFHYFTYLYTTKFSGFNNTEKKI